MLGGNYSKNREWLNEIRNVLSDLFEEIIIHEYKHWKEGGDINWDEEIKAISKYSTEKKLVIFAKSAGASLAIKAIKERAIKPFKSIFFGLPISWSIERGNNLGENLEGYSVPTMFIQQTADPYASFDELKNLILKSKVKNYELVEIPGDTHSYRDIKKIRELVLRFIKS